MQRAVQCTVHNGSTVASHQLSPLIRVSLVTCAVCSALRALCALCACLARNVWCLEQRQQLLLLLPGGPFLSASDPRCY